MSKTIQLGEIEDLPYPIMLIGYRNIIFRLDGLFDIEAIFKKVSRSSLKTPTFTT